ncbi:MAG TPA: hypothetical protein VFA33_01520 [Bryobacteraceae bacterium]|nr:hypothetical protein [Bryobacteraceae bacterium]
MSTIWVVLSYGISLGLAVLLLYVFHARSWYWHMLSVMCALGLGLMPPPANWQGPTYDLSLGSLFVFLLVWGIGGMLMFKTHHEKHA